MWLLLCAFGSLYLFLTSSLSVDLAVLKARRVMTLCCSGGNNNDICDGDVRIDIPVEKEDRLWKAAEEEHIETATSLGTSSLFSLRESEVKLPTTARDVRTRNDNSMIEKHAQYSNATTTFVRPTTFARSQTTNVCGWINAT